jgi:hypothetical protein
MVTDLSITQCYFIMVRYDGHPHAILQLTFSRQRSARMSFIHIVCVFSSCFGVCHSCHTASYMYIGLAVRTALAMGINREPSLDTSKPASVLKAEARLWW